MASPMTMLEAKLIANALRGHGFETDIEALSDVEEHYQLRAYTRWASVLLLDFATAKGFRDGIDYTLNNLAKPKLF
jgi:hypothetical protein